MSVDAPAAVAAIMARVTQVSAEPLAVTRLRDRFDPTRLAEAVAASTTSTAQTATPSTTRVGRMETPRITTASGSTSASSATVFPGTEYLTSAPPPSGTWVDRIPNARGKALAPAIAAAAQRYGLDPAFLASVFWTESSYTPNVVSRTGAIGLGQLMPETAQWLGVDPWDPMQNIDGSARLYKYFLDRNNGDITLAIASYAAGPGAVKRAGGIPDQFTANYVTKLLARTDYLAGRRATPP